jgi:hypothetical protein
MLITAYVPLSKNAGMKLLSAILHLESVLLYLTFHHFGFLPIPLWCFFDGIGGDTSNHLAT